MKKIILILLVGFMLPWNTSYSQQAPPSPPPTNCLDKCKYDRLILDDVYNYCMNEVVEKFQEKYTTCLQLPIAEQQACIAEGIRKMKARTKQCKKEYDGDFRSLLGCEAKCSLADPGPTR